MYLLFFLTSTKGPTPASALPASRMCTSILRLAFVFLNSSSVEFQLNAVRAARFPYVFHRSRNLRPSHRIISGILFLLCTNPNMALSCHDFMTSVVLLRYRAFSFCFLVLVRFLLDKRYISVPITSNNSQSTLKSLKSCLLRCLPNTKKATALSFAISCFSCVYLSLLHVLTTSSPCPLPMFQLLNEPNCLVDCCQGPDDSLSSS